MYEVKHPYLSSGKYAFRSDIAFLSPALRSSASWCLRLWFGLGHEESLHLKQKTSKKPSKLTSD